MESLVKKLADLVKAIKQIKPQHQIQSLPALKPPPKPSMTASGKQDMKMHGVSPNSKKDPKKVAQQIKDGSMSTKTQKVMLKTDWSSEDIEKADQQANQSVYHIHQNGLKITDKPLTVQEINKRHGGIQHLENNGFRLVRHNPTEVAKPKV